MKLSKIIKTKDLKSVTIHVINKESILCNLFILGRKKPINKSYKKLEVDINIPEISNRNVNHLGIKKHFYLKNENFYVNLYHY